LSRLAFLTDLNSIVLPEHTSILVIDMQNDFCADAGHTGRMLGKDVRACQAVVEPVRRLVAAARCAGIAVFWIKADYSPAHLSGPMRAKLAAKGVTTPYAVSGTWGADFYQLEPGEGDCVIEKHRHSGFTGTALELLLRERNTRTLVIAGVQTHVCIETTLRDGFTRGYYIVVPADCVGSFAEDLHLATLKCVRQHFGEVTTSSELVAIWSRSPVSGEGERGGNGR